MPAIIPTILPRIVLYTSHSKPSNSTLPINHHKTGFDALPLYAQILVIVGAVLGVIVVSFLLFIPYALHKASEQEEREKKEREKGGTSEPVRTQLNDGRENGEMHRKLAELQTKHEREKEQMNLKLRLLQQKIELDKGEIDRKLAEMENKHSGLPEYSEV